jgi:hypothetical protein
MTIDLYNPADVKKVREQLTEEQNNIDLLTGLPIAPKQHCLDHNHDTMRVRSVLSRQTNAALGKIENIWTRYLSYWYPHDLATFLEQSAEYLRRPDDERWNHPHWIKKVNAGFNRLKESQKDSVLEALGATRGKNGAERKKLFQAVILTKQFSYDTLTFIIDNAGAST